MPGARQTGKHRTRFHQDCHRFIGMRIVKFPLRFRKQFARSLGPGDTRPGGIDPIKNVLRIDNVETLPAERITANHEDRQRQGFEIQTKS